VIVKPQTKAVKISSIPYNHAGEKYGLANKNPVAYKKCGVFYKDTYIPVSCENLFRRMICDKILPSI